MFARAEYERFRVSPVDPATIRVAHVEHTLAQLEPASGGRLRVEKFAESFEGRPIFLATLGSGPRRVLLWSQMHGDEPTHTAVLLDLLSYLLRSPAEPFANEILTGCTLYMIPLLNPDGAERFTRFNAQDIDVNRDARRLSTPEGRALRRAVESLKPEFGFNLHNQNAQTAAGKPPKAVVASLLAPPPDEQRRETDAVRRAKQVAACFVRATQADVDQVDGKLSKYDDTYEPRAFGDWVQSTGAATVLVEAGGWPAADAEPLVRLHFHGLLACLQAIATENYRDVDHAAYNALPFSNRANLVDCLITGGEVLDTQRGTKFIADIAINYANGNRLTQAKLVDGKMTDVGDLSLLGATQTISASNHLIMPGRLAFMEDWTMVPPEEALFDFLLAAGVTTVIGLVRPTDRKTIDWVDRIKAMPMNWGFAVRHVPDAADATELNNLIPYAVTRGALAIMSSNFSVDDRQALSWMGVPLFEYRQRPRFLRRVGTDVEIAKETWRAHQLFGLDNRRRRIGRDFVADLHVVDTAVAVETEPNTGSQVKRVLVAGETVWENGKRTGNNPGIFLRGR